jgi:hypothetical protein
MRILLFLLFPFASFSQDLSGTWVGNGRMANYCKINIIKWNGVYIGYSYDEGMGYCKCNFVGRFDSATKKFKGVNKGVIEKTFFHMQSRYNLRYSMIANAEFLEGNAFAKTIGSKILSFGIPERVTYRKISNTIDTTEFMRMWVAAKPINKTPDSIIAMDEELIFDDSIMSDPLMLSFADSVLIQKNERHTDTVAVINTLEKELRLTILDNAIADNDTISIIHNNKVLLSKQEVTVKGTTFIILIGADNPYHEITLVANNLGKIPPNTALVIIEAGEKKYRLTASTDLTKNAMIIFKYE